MKKLLFVFMLSLGSGFLFAHHGSYAGANNSDLNIKMWDNSFFTIILDHDISKQTKRFSLKNITPGNHHIKIIKKKRNHYGHGYFVQTIYKGKIHIPSRRNVSVKVLGRNQLSFKYRKKAHHNHHNNGYGNGHGHNNGNNYGSNYGNGHGSVVMGDYSFNQLINTIQSATFDNGKLNIAKQAVGLNYFNANQVGVIMDQFTFDDSKLEFSKLAYNKTVDQENYFVVISKFTFSRSAKKMTEYISHMS